MVRERVDIAAGFATLGGLLIAVAMALSLWQHRPRGAVAAPRATAGWVLSSSARSGTPSRSLAVASWCQYGYTRSGALDLVQRRALVRGQRQRGRAQVVAQLLLGRAPMISEVTAGLPSSQASATWAGEAPCAPATSTSTSIVS